MERIKIAQGLRILLTACVIFTTDRMTPAISITSEITFAKAARAPLAGTLTLKTDVPSRVTVQVDDGSRAWEKQFFDYATDHTLPLYGFHPDTTNQITVTVRDRFRHELTAPGPVSFITDALPAGFPVLNVLVSKPEEMEPGYTLFRAVNSTQQVGYQTIVDNTGQVVWYAALVSGNDLRQLEDGNLLYGLASGFFEINLLAETVNTWPVPSTLPVDTHDGLPTDRNSILYIANDSLFVTNFPSSATNPTAPTVSTNIQFDRIVEVSKSDHTVLENWSLAAMLDPLRISYLTFVKTAQGWDAQHGNAVIEDPRDDSIIVSIRTQNAVVAFYRATGQIKWILGPHENWGPEFQKYLLTPVGSPFAWQYAQHAPVITPRGTLLLYDDGNFRASPFDTSVPDASNYSRAVEYEINEERMEITQVWQYGENLPEPIYTGAMGNAEWLPKTGHVLVDFGFVNYVNHAHPSAFASAATMARIKEVTHDANPEVVFDLAIFDFNNTSASFRGNNVYRAHRISDIYGHPALPVTDLDVLVDNGAAHLQFSGDPVHTYRIESSDDLQSWDLLALPESTADGQFDVTDDAPVGESGRFYRVVTN